MEIDVWNLWRHRRLRGLPIPCGTPGSASPAA